MALSGKYMKEADTIFASLSNQPKNQTPADIEICKRLIYCYLAAFKYFDYVKTRKLIYPPNAVYSESNQINFCRWYNSTYIFFAVTTILICIFRAASEAQNSLFHAVNQTIAVLEAMDKFVVTKNAGTIIKRTSARDKYCSLTHETSHPGAGLQHSSSTDDDEQALFWKEWANSWDMRGASEEFGGMGMGGFMGT
ncbi:hypothetical protein OIDMADRAFT_144243 [Oidiodendron maius Zn]|uniref:Uncharacterized protein n=1 Tax=Oidiodendron maius (strain Zn) TaxID=913774 RepID=A0A0C3HJK6_OIDMZ|nr:hypothetical protein OIDMADRAFT_144243 [Oidiodendron maius Zn]